MASTSKTYTLDIQVRGSRETQAMVAELAKLSSAQAKLTSASARMAAEQRRVATAVDGTATALQRANLAANQSGKGFKVMGREINGWQVNQVATQFGDLVVQLEGGAGAARAFGQQASQLGSVFGGWAGLAITAGSAVALIAPALLEAAKSSRTFETANKDLDEVLDSLNGSLDILKTDLTELRALYGRNADEVVRLARVQATLAAQNVSEELRKQVTELRSAATQISNFGRGFEVADAPLRNLATQLGLSTQETQRLSAAMVRLLQSDLADIEGTADAFEAWQQAIAAVGLDIEKLPEPLRKALEEAAGLAIRAAEASARLDEWDDLANDATGALGQTAAEVSRVAENAKRAADELQGIRNATDALSLDTSALEAQNRALAAGNDLLQARGAALIEQKRLELAGALGSEDAIIRDQARRSLAAYTDEVQRSIAAQREYNQLTEQTRSSTTAAASAKTNYDADSLSLQQFTTVLTGYRTEAEEAAVMQERLNRAAQEFGVDKIQNGTELLSRAMADLAESGREVSAEMQIIRNGLEGGLTDALTGLITGTKSASEAFQSMLDQMLRAIVEFMVSRFVQDFLTMSFGGVPSGNVTSAWTPSSSPQTVAYTVPAPNVPQATTFARTLAAPASTSTAQQRNLIGAAAEPNIVINNYAAADTGVSVVEGQDVNGQRMIEIFVEKEVKKQIGSGVLDRTLRTNYGIRRTT